MPKSVAIKEIINEIKSQITLAEDQLGSVYTLSHRIGEADFILNAAIMKNGQEYLPMMSGQIKIKTEADLKLKVNSVGFTLKHSLYNTLNFEYDHLTKGIELSLAPNEDGTVSSTNTFTFNGNSEIHDSKKQKLAVIENKQLKFLDIDTLALLESEMPMQCSSKSALNEFKQLLSSPTVKTPLKIALDDKFKKLCNQPL